MKKAFLALGLAVAALTFTNCNKQENDLPGANAVKARIALSMEDTKTANDGLNTVWSAGDELSVWYQSGNTYSSNFKFVVSEDNGSVAEGTMEEAPSGTCNWIAFYPYNSYFVDPANNNDNPGRTYLGGRSDKAQTQDGYNSKAHVCGTGMPLYGIATDVPAGQTPAITMKHLATLAEIVVTNNSGSGITITGLELSAPDGVDIVGQYNISFATDTPTYTPYNTYQSNTAKLTVSNGTVLANGSSAKFYLVLKPFTAGSLTLKVIADAGEVTKDTKLPSSVTFQAGHIKTLNFSYEKPAQLETLTVADLVEAAANSQSFSGDFAGAIVTFVSGKNAFMQDDNNGILIFMDGHGLTAGDFVSGTVSGSGSPYKNLPELTSFTYTSKVAGTVPDPIELTLSQLLANFDSYISRYVKLTGVTATSAFSSRNANLADGDDTIVLRDQKNGLTIEKDATYDIIGFPCVFNDTKQMGVWVQDNIIKAGGSQGGGGDQEEVEATISLANNNKTNVSLYVDETYDLAAETNSTASISYESSDPDVASVSDAGIITAKSAGETTVTVSVAAVPGSFTAASKEVKVTVTDKPQDAGGEWVETAVSALKSGDEFIFVGTNATGSFAMSNDGSGGSQKQPKAVAVTVSGNKLSSAPDNAIWTLGINGDGTFVFNVGEKHLYVTATNNGLRVGDGNACNISITEGYLTMYDTANPPALRYLGIYNSADWRSYKLNDKGEIADNIKGQTFKFYVKK